jgi:hypothetical protein
MPISMNDMYKDGSDPGCIMCEDCGFCIECGDCEKFGCGLYERPKISYKLNICVPTNHKDNNDTSPTDDR